MFRKNVLPGGRRINSISPVPKHAIAQGIFNSADTLFSQLVHSQPPPMGGGGGGHCWLGFIRLRVLKTGCKTLEISLLHGHPGR